MQPAEEIARQFRALGDPTRLRILEYLRDCSGPVAVDSQGEARRVVGATVGEVCCQITGDDRTNSTVSHHIKELRTAGLISVERRGRHMICTVNLHAVEALAGYLADSRKIADSEDDCC